jgi:hypothetical protein
MRRKEEMFQKFISNNNNCNNNNVKEHWEGGLFLFYLCGKFQFIID